MRNEFDNIPIPEKLDEIIGEKMKIVRKEEKKYKARQWLTKGLVITIMLACSVVLCVKNPAFAEKLPLIGYIFERIEYQSFPGDYNGIGEILEEASVTEDEKTKDSENSTETTDASEYTKTAHGITVTLSEVYCNSLALYITIQVQSQEALPEVYSWQFFTQEKYSFKQEGDFDAPIIQGEIIDPYTIVGMIRLDLDYNVEGIDIPDEFTVELNMNKLTGTLVNPDTDAGEPMDKYYDGPWSFSLDVKKNTQDTQVVNINETNELGIGFEKVVKDRFEIEMFDIYESPEMAADYFAVMLDADGRLMDYGNDGSCAVLQIGDRDVSKVDIFLIDYLLWMDELKGDIWRQENPPLTADGRTYKELLLEKCAYHREVIFEE